MNLLKLLKKNIRNVCLVCGVLAVVAAVAAIVLYRNRETFMMSAESMKNLVQKSLSGGEGFDQEETSTE